MFTTSAENSCAIARVPTKKHPAKQAKPTKRRTTVASLSIRSPAGKLAARSSPRVKSAESIAEGNASDQRFAAYSRSGNQPYFCKKNSDMEGALAASPGGFDNRSASIT